MNEDIRILENLKDRKLYFTSSMFQTGWVELNETEKQALENLIARYKELEEKLKKINQYIRDEMYIDDNPTICGDEEDTITELPISLNLYNEGLRELLELLEE